MWKHTAIIVLFFCLSITAVLAEESEVNYASNKIAIYYETNGKMGLKSSDGIMLTKPEYDYISYFDQHGLARLYLDNKIGIIRSDGVIIVPPINCSNITCDFYYHHDGIEELRDEVLIYSIWRQNEERYGFYSLNGDIISEACWEDTSSFKNGFAVVKQQNKWNMINNKGDLIFPIWWDEFYIEKNNSTTFLTDTQGVQIDENGNIYAEYQKKEDNIWYLVSLDGHKLISPMKCNALIKTKNGYYYNDGTKWGLMGFNEKILFPPQWEQIFFFQSDLFIMQVGGKKGLLDSTGQIVLDCLYDDFELINKDKWLAEDLSSFYIFNSSGACIKKILKEEFPILYREDDNYLYYASKDGYWGFMDANGKILSHVNENDVLPQDFSEFNDGWIEVELLDNQIGFMSVEGTVLSSADWETTQNFHYGFAAVQLSSNEQWIYIDTQGKPICEKTWDGCDEFFPAMSGPIARVDQSTNSDEVVYGYIDTEGNLLNGFHTYY